MPEDYNNQKENSQDGADDWASLPSELIGEIGKYFSLKEKGRLIRTAKQFSLFRKDVDAVKAPEAAELMSHVVRAELEKAEAIIQKKPYLLLSTVKLEGYPNRERTVFRTALAAQDVAIQVGEKEMAEMIASYLDYYYPGEKEKQYQAQFPKGWEAEKRRRHQRGVAILTAVVNAICQAPSEARCASALEKLRTYLNKEYIQQEYTPERLKNVGTDFDDELLVEAFKLYGQYYNKLGGLDKPKTNLFWRRVIGYLERFVSIRTGQDLCQGPYYLTKEGEKPCRELVFRNNPDVVYFPLDSDPYFRLGYEYAVSPCWAGCPEKQRYLCALPYRSAQALCQAKKAGLERLMCELCHQQPKNTCILI